MMRTQQLDCYAAEAGLDVGTRFVDVGAAQRFVDGLRDTPWWQLQGYSLHVLRIEVHPAHHAVTRWAAQSTWYPSKSAGKIDVTQNGLNTLVLLHEVAHVLADAIHRSTGHDPAWARTFLTLVSYVMGSDAYLALQRSFDAHGVDYDAPRAPQAGAIAL